MPCLRALSRSRRSVLLPGILIVSTSCAGAAIRLRGLTPYRAPAIVLAYPERATALPADKAVVLFRFAPREADDPIDITSFKAAVNGVDRTDRFHITSSEAWGTLGDTGTTPSVAPQPQVTSGPHTIGARVCSVRGACSALTVVVDVRPWERALSPNDLTQRDGVMPNKSRTASHAATASRSSRKADAGV